MTNKPLLERLPLPLRFLLVMLALYLFLVGIGSMGAAFKNMGKDFTAELLGSEASPVISLFIGILATTLVQSSSTTTSIIVGMVAAGAISFHAATYMVMGANVGTTVTNASKLNAGPLETEVKELEMEVLQHFDRTVRAFKESDAAQASVLMKEYKTDISSRCAQIEERLVKGQVDLPSADAVAVALYLRFLKRISAHARNLISSLVNPFHRIGYKEKPAD